MSIYDLFCEVFDYANTFYVKDFRYNIDAKLKGITIEPYLPRASVWDTLQKLCEATLSFVSIDKNDVINVTTEYDGRNGANSGVTVNKHNAFSLSIPNFADMVANNVEVNYFKKRIEDEEKELVKIEGINIEANKEKTIELIMSDYYTDERIEFKSGSGLMVFSNMTKVKQGLNMRISVMHSVKLSNLVLFIYGHKISFDKQSASDSVAGSELHLYSHPECKLIQDKDAADAIVSKIMSLYPTGTRSVASNWRGDTALITGDRFVVEDRFDNVYDYNCTYIKHTVDNGYRQDIKGVLKTPY